MQQPLNDDRHFASHRSGARRSSWMEEPISQDFPALTQSIETDVLVVGAGIAGLSTAYNLVREGRQVVLVDDGLPCSGETGRTTAHLANALDDRYYDIVSMHGEEAAKLAAESHTAAINFIEATISELNIDCDFTRLNGYLFLHSTDKKESLDQEFEATQKAGLSTEMVTGMPGIQEEGRALMFRNQAQFHPIKYLNALISYLTKNGGEIYSNTRVTDFKKNSVVANGYEIRANHIVVATNSPINNIFTHHTKQHPYRTYVIGGLLPKGSVEPALWWDTGDQDSKWISAPYHYARIHPYDAENDLLIVGGEDHKTGQDDAEEKTMAERFHRLETWTRKRFPAMAKVVYQWSGQVLEPLDYLAFIGRNPGDENVYVITGDSGNGMTHGTIGGILITDLITGKENPWVKIYDPGRISLKATPDFLEEAGNMAAQYLDHFKTGDIDSQNELAPGTGAIMSMGLKKIAVYKNEDGRVHACSAICPHLGCVVQYNEAEKTFDCPCHGSRFTHEGVVINGPAHTNLEAIAIENEQLS